MEWSYDFNYMGAHAKSATDFSFIQEQRVGGRLQIANFKLQIANFRGGWKARHRAARPGALAKSETKRAKACQSETFDGKARTH
jgi:hypothetical protein